MLETIHSGKKIKDDVDIIYQFIPEEYVYLTQVDKIVYKDTSLKTDYIINIINELIIKVLLTGEDKFNLWSLVLKKKYGKHYNIYFDYLENCKFIALVSNYYVGKKAKTYKLLNTNLDNLKRCYIDDKILLKKYSSEFLNQSFLYFNNSPIPENIRKMLVNDLKFIKIDYKNAFKYLNKCKKDNLIDYQKYIKNLNSIDCINTGHVFFKFDDYGRMHTNYTILKKEIRNNYLTIDGDQICEIDVKNSQPFFFSKLLKQEIGEEHFNQECYRFIDLVKNGLLYDELQEKIPELITRDDAKILVYKVLFGKNNEKNSFNQQFKSVFPTIYEYIIELKSLDNSHKELSHKLQRMESDFIFGKVIKTIKQKYPNIKLFTVHDSILFPKKYENEVKLIFDNFIKLEI